MFGGFDTANAVSNEVTILVDKGNGEFSMRVFKDKDEATAQETRASLQNGDKFLLNGVAVHDPIAQELIIPGQDYVHCFSLSSHKFRTMRSIITDRISR